MQLFSVRFAFFTVVLLLRLVGESSQNYAQRTCTDIQTETQGIWWIGLLRTRFILITDTNAVYDLSTSALDNTGHYLHLSNPEQMDTKYPELHKRMTQDATGFFTGAQKRLCVVDATSEYLYTESQNLKKGQLYDFSTKKAVEYDVNDQMTNGNKPQLFMSAYDPLHFYAVYYNGKSDPSGLIMKGRFADHNTMRTSTIVQMVGNKYYICKVGTTTDQIALSTGKCADGPAQWNAVNGFADTYNFYVLATNRTVLVFAKSMFDNPGTPVRVHKVRYEDFFVCGGSLFAKWYIILAILIVVILLIICFCCICCIGQKKRGRGALLTRSVNMSVKKSKSKSRKKKQSHSKSTKKTRKKSGSKKKGHH